MKFEGKVIKKTYARGSKSERDAVVIVLPKGEFLLRRVGGNPFRDEAIESLVGKNIKGEGKITDVSLFMDKWEESN